MIINSMSIDNCDDTKKNVIERDIPRRKNPVNTETIELVLCLTTSVSFSASNLGYFRFIIIPIMHDINDRTIAIAINNNASIIDIWNLIININVPIIIAGNIITKLAYTLDIIIFLGSIGNDLSILIFFPSNDINELVIDVVNVPNRIIASAIEGIIFIASAAINTSGR